MLVPIKTCQLISRKLFREKQPMENKQKKNQQLLKALKLILFQQRLPEKCSLANITINSGLLIIHFPNYESVIPNDNEKILKL